MNAVEIEAAVSDLAAEPFDPAEFAFQFLAAFDKKETTLKRLRKGDSNRSDVPNGVLLQANIHMAVCQLGETRATLERPGLDQAREGLRAGDTLVVWKLDRLGRSVKHLVDLVGEL